MVFNDHNSCFSYFLLIIIWSASACCSGIIDKTKGECMVNRSYAMLVVCALVAKHGYAMETHNLRDAIKEVNKREEESRSDLIELYAADFQGTKQEINAIDISANGKHIIVGAGDMLRMWYKTETWKEGAQYLHESPISGVCFAAGNKAVSTDQKGNVHIWNYKNENLVPYQMQHQAFQIMRTGFYANMIALNNKGDRVVVGHYSKNDPIVIYARNTADVDWQEEKEQIPVHKAMLPTALGWTSKDTLIAYGKLHADDNLDGHADQHVLANDNLNGNSDQHVLMEWQKKDALWKCINRIEFNESNEETVLKSVGYTLTRRESMRAASVAAKTIVLASDTSLRISSEPYENVMKACEKAWK